ncbi:Cytochrome P450 [Popillia japonica]|uniref:Cytochrome P450 n=1 Tax=Popillia japonica TaxID=7064 RepID=A0AAW1MDG6_POPJA
MLVIPLVLVVIAWYLVICLKWKKNIFDTLQKIPGLKWYPVVGTYSIYAKASRADVIYKFLEVTRKYAPFYRSWNGSIPEVHISKADHLQVLLRSSTHTTKGPFYEYLFPWLGDGVFLSEGAKWFYQRKLLTPMFHFKILEGFVKIFGEKASILNDTMQPKADGQFFQLLPYLHVSTLSVICETTMGVPLNKLTDNPLAYVKSIHDITELAMWRFWRPWIPDVLFYLLPQGRYYKKLLKELHGFSDKVVANRKAIMEGKQTRMTLPGDLNGQEHISFMDLLIDETENRHTMSDADLKALVDTFLLAGYETTGNTLGWTLFLLGNHPEFQEKAFEEARRVLKGKKAPTTIAEVNELRYIECVVKESLRLYPILPFITRRTTEEFEIDGYKIPTGTQAIAHILGVQTDPEYYPEPMKFDPDRFTPENSKGRHPFAYIPFSAGPRNCLGIRFALVELKTVVATIVSRYKITSMESAEKLRVFAHVFIRPQEGLQVKLESRDGRKIFDKAAMLVIPLLLVIIAWYLVICLKWKKNIFDTLQKIPGLKWYPIIGTYSIYGKASRADVIYKFIEVTRKYSPFYRSWNGSTPEVHIMKADHLQVLLRSSTHTPKGPFYNYLFPWLGDGVFLSEGAKWFFQRKLLTPMFHFKILERFVNIFGEKANTLNDTLESKADGQYFQLLPYLHVSTLSAVCETTMGVPLNKLTNDPLTYIKSIHDITELAMWRFWRPWIPDVLFYLLPQGRYYKKLVQELHNFSDKVVAYRKANLEGNQTKMTLPGNKNGREHISFMDLLIDETENRHTMSDADLKALVNTFLLAGYETTGNTLGWTLFLLGNHPEFQEKAFEEARKVLKGKKTPNTLDEVNELRYIECVVKEALRLYPILPFITRRTTEDFEIDGYKVPTGTQAIAHIWGVQTDPEYYPEPMKFDPDRFTPENSKARHPFAYIPFSAGPRNCLGMRFALIELKTVVATIVSRYKITSLEPAETLRIFAHVFIRPQEGLQVKLESRVIHDDPRPGRPKTSTDERNVKRVADALEQDRRATCEELSEVTGATCEELSEVTGIPPASVYRILTNDLKKRKISARWVPHNLTGEQKQKRLDIANLLKQRFGTMGPTQFDW